MFSALDKTSTWTAFPDKIHSRYTLFFAYEECWLAFESRTKFCFSSSYDQKPGKLWRLAQTDRFKFKLGKKVMYSTRQRLSWQSLASRKTRLETWFSILENFRIESRVEFRKSRVGSFDFRVERNNEFAGWMSFREVNWIREVLSCDVEGVTSRLSSCCVTKKPKNAFNLSLLPETFPVTIP